QPYSLDVDGEKFSGNTDGSGALKHLISPIAIKGHLLVGSGEKKREYYLQLGYTGPIDTINGAQARLYDLGYYDGPVDGNLNGHTRSGIVVFQMKHKLPVTGNYDQATQDKLKERFGC